VVVATKAVPQYTELKNPAEFFEIQERSADQAPANRFDDLGQIKDKRVNSEMKAGVHITPEDVSDTLQGLPIPMGLVGSALKVDEESAVGYFVRPGKRVDINWTSRSEKPTSRVLLRNVLVVSVGGQSAAKADQPTIQAQTVNVAVSRFCGSLLDLAAQHGKLKLFLSADQNQKGEMPEEDRAVSVDDLIGARPSVVATAPKSEKPTDPNRLPLTGFNVNEIEEKKRKEEAKVEEPIKPDWTVEVVYGAAAPKRFDFYKDGAPESKKPEPK
jgi:Flp pilus assembly protein CpaB